MKVKIEGNRSPDDLRRVAEAGADYAGVIVDVPQSPRSVSSADVAQVCARAPLDVVLVFLDADAETVARAAAAGDPAAVQLHGAESPDLVAQLSRELGCEVWKVVHLPPMGGRKADVGATLAEVEMYSKRGAAKVLLDTAASADGAGGTGVRSDWDAAAEIVRRSPVPVILAGGLNPDNVADAVRQVRPYGVDVASGVEREPGVKDWDAVRRFVASARRPPE